MAFSSAVSGQSHIMGDLKFTWGTYNASGVTGGNIDTGLTTVVAMQLTGSGSSVVADAPTINETLPIAGSAITIVVTSGTTGYWVAWGY